MLGLNPAESRNWSRPGSGDGVSRNCSRPTGSCRFLEPCQVRWQRGKASSFLISLKSIGLGGCNCKNKYLNFFWKIWNTELLLLFPLSLCLFYFPFKNINLNNQGNRGGNSHQSVSIDHQKQVVNVDNNNGWHSWNSIWDYGTVRHLRALLFLYFTYDCFQ